MIVTFPKNYFEWNSPSEIRTQLVYRCSAPECKNELVHEYFGLTPDIRSHPAGGWNMVGCDWKQALWICPNHRVVVTVDGKEFDNA